MLKKDMDMGYVGHHFNFGAFEASGSMRLTIGGDDQIGRSV